MSYDATIDGTVHNFNSARWDGEHNTEYHLAIADGRLVTCLKSGRLPIQPVEGRRARVTGDWLDVDSGNVMIIATYEPLARVGLAG